MSDRSFVRAGGYAGILLALTSWAAVVAFFAGLGQQTFQLLYALIAFWALLGIGAVREVIRPAGQAWSRYATLVGSIAAVGTIAGSLYDVARVRAGMDINAPNPANPLSVMTLALTGVWFVIATILLSRTRGIPRLLVLLGYVAFADLTLGFLGALLGLTVPIAIPGVPAPTPLATLAAIIAGGVGGPIFWLWLGIVLLRSA
jgi:hypothetical protein